VQALCPHCSQRIVIDDAKVPDRPFSVKCPKCQGVVKLQGKAAGADVAAPPPPPLESAPVPPTPAPVADEQRAQKMTQIRRELGGGEAHQPRALVSFPDHSPASGVAPLLTRLGYEVDFAEGHDEAAHLIEQGVYSLVATARVQAAPGKGETLYQRISRLSPEARRRLFLILVGDEFKSGDGTQAFVVLADLVLSTRDAVGAENAIRNTLAERTRVYQAFTDARRRFEASAT
jgi:predicted Zn finger-like uncharacterized protein